MFSPAGIQKPDRQTRSLTATHCTHKKTRFQEGMLRGAEYVDTVNN
jgi:hypothetical protein